MVRFREGECCVTVRVSIGLPSGGVLSTCQGDSCVGVVASADGLTGTLFCVLETTDPSTSPHSQYRGFFWRGAG